MPGHCLPSPASSHVPLPAIKRRVSPSLTKEASGGFLWQMRTVGLKILKNKLSEYVRAAAAGETVLVTDRDRVVARIVPPQTPRDTADADERYAELIRAGLITPARNPKRNPPPRGTPVMSFETLMQELDEDRADR